MKSPITPYLVVSIVALVAFSCKDEDLTVDPSNSGALSKAIVPLFNSTRLSGEMPSPSSDADAPHIATPTGKIFMFGRSSGSFNANVLSGEVAGLYVQVKGAGEYFRSFSGASNSPQTSFGFMIENNAKPGSFILRYAVFDSQDRVSNIVEQLVVTMDPGGPDNLFPSDSISVKKVTQHVSQFEFEYVVGVPNVNAYETYLDCSDEYKVVDVADETAIDKFTFIFFGDGNLGLVHRSHTKLADVAASNNTCTVQYTTTTVAINYEGWWAYSSEYNRLLLEYRAVAIIDGIRHESSETHKDYSVQKTGSKMIWTSTAEDDNYSIIEFE